MNLGLAVPGVFPLIYPKQGARGPMLEKLGSLGMAGPQAYKALKRAAKERVFFLPDRVNILPQGGGLVGLGPGLLTPRDRKQMGTVEVVERDGGLMVTLVGGAGGRGEGTRWRLRGWG